MCQIDFFSIPDHMEVSEFTELTVTLFPNCASSAWGSSARATGTGRAGSKMAVSGLMRTMPYFVHYDDIVPLPVPSS